MLIKENLKKMKYCWNLWVETIDKQKIMQIFNKKKI